MAGPELKGRFVWHELLTTDGAAARAFYPRFVNWSSEAWSTDSRYMLWVARSGPVAGMMPLPEEAKAMGAPPNWLTYIGTTNVDATVQRAVSLGARVLKEPDTVEGAGRFAILADPQGAVFGVTTAETPAPASSPPKAGQFSWHELASTDPVGAFQFYHTLFGWEQTDAFDMGTAGSYQMYGWDGLSKGGMYAKPPDQPGPSYWLPYVLVANVDQAVKRAEAGGGKVVMGPLEVPGGDRIAVLCDPQGAAVALHSKAAPQRATRKKAARKKPLKKTLKQSAARKRAARKAPSAKKKPGARRRRRTPRSGAARKRPRRRRPPRKP